VKYLLDTNIIVDHIRGKKAIQASLLEQGSGASIITQAELFYGAYKSTQPKKNLKIVKGVFVDLEIEVIDLSEETISQYGKVKALLEKKGKRLDEFDLLIGATALTFKLTLVTRNTKHFNRIKNLKLLEL